MAVQPRIGLQPAGSGRQAIYSSWGKALEIEGAATAWDAKLVQAPDSGWDSHRLFQLTPIIGGEPHRLAFSNITNDAPCGDSYYWYDIAQPNLQPLRAPADSFVQLIFAGGKQSATGADVNPFIAQQVSGNLVAIDPSGYMTGGTTATSGACLSTQLLYDSTKTAGGACCVRTDGRYGTFKVSSWSSTTYLCSL